MNNFLTKLVAFAMTAAFAVADFTGALAADSRPAKAAFGAMTLASSQPSQPIGFYAKGCQAGAVQLPYDGPTWEVMRLARNRRWGQPQRHRNRTAAGSGQPGDQGRRRHRRRL